jgi:hypothetical protein
MNAIHHTDPPPEFRPLLNGPFPCTNQFRCLPENTRARSSLWILDSANRHHIASARLQAGGNAVVQADVAATVHFRGIKKGSVNKS